VAFEMDFDTIIKLVSPLLVAIVGAVVKRVIEGKPKVITYLVHAASHPLPPAPAPAPAPVPALPAPQEQESVPQEAHAPPPPAPGARWVHTHAVVVKNTGKKTATNVRINHAVFPLSYQLYPPISHTVTPGQGESADICIPVLVPGEQVTISYLYFPPLLWTQIVGPVKSDEGMAKTIQTIPTAPPPRGAIWILWAVLFVGASTIVYWLLRLLPLVLQ
jgi:hypothetical protein